MAVQELVRYNIVVKGDREASELLTDIEIHVSEAGEVGPQDVVQFLAQASLKVAEDVLEGGLEINEALSNEDQTVLDNATRTERERVHSGSVTGEFFVAAPDAHLDDVGD